MALKKRDVEELVRDRLFPAFRDERERLDRIDRWYRWQHDDPYIPRDATKELKALRELAKTPWLGLVVTAVAQAMFVDGYRSKDAAIDATPWEAWQRNDMDARQIAVHRSALAYGQAFVTVLPGDLGAFMRGVSPRRMLAFYGDEVDDDWPMYALRADPDGDSWLLRLYDDEFEWRLSADSGGDKVEYVEFREHGAGVCPVVRVANMLDLDGRATGEVEPFIPTAARVDKTNFDRLLAQHYNSWKVRTVAGMAKPDDDEEAVHKKLELRQNDLLVAEDPDTKFGTLDETPLAGFIEAHRADVEALAAVSQTPSHQLTGQMVNLSAEALAAAESGLHRKVTERKHAFGKSWDQALRLAAALEGDAEAAADTSARVTWADMESRSLAQAVDALGKAAQMLGVPPQALWSRIPGVTKTDVEEWRQLAEQGDPLAQLNGLIERQMEDASGPA